MHNVIYEFFYKTIQLHPTRIKYFYNYASFIFTYLNFKLFYNIFFFSKNKIDQKRKGFIHFFNKIHYLFVKKHYVTSFIAVEDFQLNHGVKKVEVDICLYFLI